MAPWEAGKPQVLLAISTYEKGQAFLREVARLGVPVILLTVDKLRHADWPWDVLAEFHTMPEEMSQEQITNTVCYLARTRNIGRIVALDEFDMEMAAGLREHMRIPGMGLTTTRYFRDKLAMRSKASRFQIPGLYVPEFTSVINHPQLAAFMLEVPPPWVLKPRQDASAIGIRKVHSAEEVWALLEALGDRAHWHLLERFVPGDIYHVDGIVSEREVVFAQAHKYGRSPMALMQGGGVFSTRSLDRAGEESQMLLRLHAQLAPALGMVRGVTHAEFIRAHEDGRYYFLEIAARVGGAFIAEVVECSAGLNPWEQWARIEVADMRGERYVLPPVQRDYAGSVLSLARQEHPDTSAYTDTEICYRMKKKSHAGLIVKSSDPERVRELLEGYAERFAHDFQATLPPPPRPTA